LSNAFNNAIGYQQNTRLKQLPPLDQVVFGGVMDAVDRRLMMPSW